MRLDDEGANALMREVQTNIAREIEPRGGALDTAWPCTPVAHLAFETDTHFATIHCRRV